MASPDETTLRDGIHWITPRIAVGRFASPDYAGRLLDHGVTHILNVSESSSLPAIRAAAFCGILDLPIVDVRRLPEAVLLGCLEFIHGVLEQPDTRVYVHCLAGQNRAPTVVWLYFIAVGIDANEAKEAIVARSPFAIPGHSSLVDDRLIRAARRHGQQHHWGPEPVGWNAML